MSSLLPITAQSPPKVESIDSGLSYTSFVNKNSASASLCEEDGLIARKGKTEVRRVPQFLYLSGCLLQPSFLCIALPYTLEIVPCIYCSFLHIEIDLSNSDVFRAQQGPMVPLTHTHNVHTHHSTTGERFCGVETGEFDQLSDQRCRIRGF